MTVFVETPKDEVPKKVYQDLNLRAICKHCKNPVPNIIEDFAAGDRICGDCGLVFDNRIIDERSEWRTFADSEGDDPSRVGAAGDPLLGGESHLDATQIGHRDGGTGHAKDLNRLHGKATSGKGDKHLTQAFKAIQTMCEQINLNKIVIDSAKQAFKKADDEKLFKGKTEQAISAACIYIACREQNVTRTFKEICGLTNVPKKDIGRIYKVMAQKFHTGPQNISGEAMISRFSSNLDLDMIVRRSTLRIYGKAQQDGLLAGKSPITIVAACLYFASSLSNDPKPAREIAQFAGCTESTLRNAYKSLYNVRQQLYDDLIKDVPVEKGIEYLPSI